MGSGAEAASRDGPGLEEGRPQEELGGGGEEEGRTIAKRTPTKTFGMTI